MKIWKLLEVDDLGVGDSGREDVLELVAHLGLTAFTAVEERGFQERLFAHTPVEKKSVGKETESSLY